MWTDPGDQADPKPRLDWSRLALPVLTLAAVGFSAALFVQLLALRVASRSDYLFHNALGKAPRVRLLISLAVAAVVPVLLAIPLLLRRPRDVRRVERGAQLLGPLALLCLLVPLTSVTFSRESQIYYLLLLAVFVLGAEPLFRRSFAAAHWIRARLFLPRDPTRVRWWNRPWFPFVVVVVAALAYAVINSYFTVMNHRRLGTTAFDLGIYDNLMWNAMHGHPFRAPVLFGPAGGNNLASHAEFGMLLFVPIYALRPGAETMLIMQSFLLGLSAIPLYLFAKTQLPRGVSAVVAVAYLLYAPLHGPNYYDFHWLTITVFFHFWLYYAIARCKTVLTVVLVLVLFSIREDIAVGLAALGAFLLFTQLRPRLGFILAASSVVWFGVDRFIIMPLAGQWWFQNMYNDLFADGETSYASVIKTLISNPIYTFSTLLRVEKLQYALHMLAPVAFLPARRLSTLLLILPGVFFTIFSTNYPPLVSTAFQYTLHWIPYIFLGVVIVLVLLGRSAVPYARASAVATMAIALGCHSFCFGALLQHDKFQGGFSMIQFHMTPEEHQRYADLRALVAMIPPTASVAATENETPHVSARKTVYPLRQSPGAVDYLLIGRSHVGGALPFLSAAFAAGSYGLVAEKGDELFLFKLGPKTPGTDAARVKLGAPP